MKKKGFTLIELLAVIVVLAVIALIATPIVLNLVKTAKIGSAEQSVTGYVKAVENTIIKDMINNKEVSDGTYKYDSIEADISGKRPTSGEYIVKNGRVESGNFCVDGYYIEYKNSTSKYNKDKACNNSNPSVSSGVTKVEPTSTDTHKGIVYLDPTNLKNSCNESNSVSTTGTKTGCMKWYIYSEDDSNYNMILDHNTTETVAYNSTGSNTEMKEVKTALESDTSTWDSSLKARLITANEVARITGNTGFDASQTGMGWFCLDTNAPDDTNYCAKAEGTSAYKWLFDNTKECTSYGCDIADDSTYGYWTSTPYAGGAYGAWAVTRDGDLYDDYVVNDLDSGVRPVITVSKDIFK